MSRYYESQEYCKPPLSLSLDRLVFRAVFTLDRELGSNILSRQVMSCFNKEYRATVTRDYFADYLYVLMPALFDAVEDQMEVLMPRWGEDFTKDQAETVLHNGLIFAARVFRRYARYGL